MAKTHVGLVAAEGSVKVQLGTQTVDVQIKDLFKAVDTGTGEAVTTEGGAVGHVHTIRVRDGSMQNSYAEDMRVNPIPFYTTVLLTELLANARSGYPFARVVIDPTTVPAGFSGSISMKLASCDFEQLGIVSNLHPGFALPRRNAELGDWWSKPPTATDTHGAYPHYPSMVKFGIELGLLHWYAETANEYEFMDKPADLTIYYTDGVETYRSVAGNIPDIRELVVRRFDNLVALGSARGVEPPRYEIFEPTFYAEGELGSYSTRALYGRSLMVAACQAYFAVETSTLTFSDPVGTAFTNLAGLAPEPTIPPITLYAGELVFIGAATYGKRLEVVRFLSPHRATLADPIPAGIPKTAMRAYAPSAFSPPGGNGSAIFNPRGNIAVLAEVYDSTDVVQPSATLVPPVSLVIDLATLSASRFALANIELQVVYRGENLGTLRALTEAEVLAGVGYYLFSLYPGDGIIPAARGIIYPTGGLTVDGVPLAFPSNRSTVVVRKI